MKKTTLLLFLAVLAVSLTLAGCSKKKVELDSGITPGQEPEAAVTRVDEGEKFPETPPIKDPGIGDEDLAGGPLKDVYFDFDRADIRADQQPTLESNARWLRSHERENVLIEGHCDERGTEEYNLALGDRRANSAKQYLMMLGISERRLSTISYGEAYPGNPRHNEEAWAKNRRAHFTLVAPKVGKVQTGR